jgi:hypothetical protein
VWRVQDGAEAEWVEPGNSVICSPSGEIVAGPLRHEERILTADIDLSRVDIGDCSTQWDTKTVQTSSSYRSTRGAGKRSRSSPTQPTAPTDMASSRELTDRASDR